MSDAKHVTITTGPAGRNTHVEIDGVPIEGACSFTLIGDCDKATRLIVEYVNVEVEVDALVDVTAFEAKNKVYQRVHLVNAPEVADG